MRKTVLNLFTAVFALIFLVSGFLLVIYYVNSNKQEQVYDQLSQIMEQEEATDVLEEAQSPYTAVIDPEGNTQMILRQFGQLYKINPDMIGWMRIEGTVLDYPVMYKPDAKDFYLRKNFHGERPPTAACTFRRPARSFPSRTI